MLGCFDLSETKSKHAAAFSANGALSHPGPAGVLAGPSTFSNWFPSGCWCVCAEHQSYCGGGTAVCLRSGGEGSPPLSLSPFLAFSGMFCESERVCRLYFAHNAADWRLTDRNRSLLVVWLAGSGFSCLEMELWKKRERNQRRINRENDGHRSSSLSFF